MLLVRALTLVVVPLEEGEPLFKYDFRGEWGDLRL